MFRRAYLVLVSFAITALLTLPAPRPAEAVEASVKMCLVGGSTCEDGRDCCSGKCRRYSDGSQLCEHDGSVEQE